MYLTTDDEWALAVAALTLCALVIITIWIVVFFIQSNRRHSQRRDAVDMLTDILKPSRNGRSKKGSG